MTLDVRNRFEVQIRTSFSFSMSALKIVRRISLAQRKPSAAEKGGAGVSPARL